MGVILAPIVEGKLQAWKDWTRGELMGSRSEEFKDLNRRYGLTRHVAWLTETPAGPMVIALHEGPGGDEFMPKLAASSEEFDGWFRDKIKELHGIDVTQPPPGPMPELYTDAGG